MHNLGPVKCIIRQIVYEMTNLNILTPGEVHQALPNLPVMRMLECGPNNREENIES